MKRTRIVFAGCALLLIGTATSSLAASQVTNEVMQKFGVTKAEAVAYRALMLVAPERVPIRMRPYLRVPPKGTTPLLFELKRDWDDIPSEYRGILSQLLTRPGKTRLPLSIPSPSGHFRVHYSLTGPDAVEPDYPDSVAKIFDHCWQVEVDELGFRAPPPDNGLDGPEYDVYIMNTTDYGYTTAEEEVPDTPRDDWTTYIVVDNNYNEDRFYSKGIDGLKVTAAHEFFHAIHFGYRSFLNEDAFYYEASAVWMEDLVFDEVNDYYQYLPTFFNQPEKPFNTYDDWHEYGLSLWNKMLERLFGRDIVRQIWEEMIHQPGLDAMATVLQRHGDSFERLLTEFQLWNYFTGSRADPENFYREGADYPELRFSRHVPLDSAYASSDSARSLAAVFDHFRVMKSNAFRVSFLFDLPTAWMYGIAVFGYDGEHWAQVFRPGVDADLGFLQTFSTFLVVPVNVFQRTGWEESHQRFKMTVDTRPADYRPRFETLDPVPNPFRPTSQGYLEWSFRLATPVEVTVYVLSEYGAVVRKTPMGLKPDGFHAFRWDGRNDHGGLVASGIYVLQLVAGNQIGRTKVAVVR